MTNENEKIAERIVYHGGHIAEVEQLCEGSPWAGEEFERIKFAVIEALTAKDQEIKRLRAEVKRAIELSALGGVKEKHQSVIEMQISMKNDRIKTLEAELAEDKITIGGLRSLNELYMSRISELSEALRKAYAELEKLGNHLSLDKSGTVYLNENVMIDIQTALQGGEQKGGFTPRTEVTKIEPAIFCGTPQTYAGPLSCERIEKVMVDFVKEGNFGPVIVNGAFVDMFYAQKLAQAIHQAQFERER